MNVLIPMAGAGKRFAEAGYLLPKPLIDVGGIPMIRRVRDNIGAHNDPHIYLVQKSHWEAHGQRFIDAVADDTAQYTILFVDGLTEGAACTTLLAESHINTDEPLLLVNSDQLIGGFDITEFLSFIHLYDPDGCILTFEASHPKWSYAKVDTFGRITEVAEKNPISHRATVGVYYWKHGQDYVRYAHQMIAKNIRTNNEFYVCPVFNEAILDNKRILEYPVSTMYGLGTPEDLQTYLQL